MRLVVSKLLLYPNIKFLNTIIIYRYCNFKQFIVYVSEQIQIQISAMLQCYKYRSRSQWPHFCGFVIWLQRFTLWWSNFETINHDCPDIAKHLSLCKAKIICTRNVVWWQATDGGEVASENMCKQCCLITGNRCWWEVPI